MGSEPAAHLISLLGTYRQAFALMLLSPSLHPLPDRYSGHIDQPALADDPAIGGGHYTLYFGGPSRPG